MAENKSIIAAFRQQQEREEEAARYSGLAVVANHKSITARMERGASRILRLIEEGKHEEAQALMATDAWGMDSVDSVGEQEASDEKVVADLCIKKGKRKHGKH